MSSKQTCAKDQMREAVKTYMADLDKQLDCYSVWRAPEPSTWGGNRSIYPPPRSSRASSPPRGHFSARPTTSFSALGLRRFRSSAESKSGWREASRPCLIGEPFGLMRTAFRYASPFRQDALKRPGGNFAAGCCKIALASCLLPPRSSARPSFRLLPLRMDLRRNINAYFADRIGNETHWNVDSADR